MKDFAGNELEIGDKVLICVPGYKHLVWAEVESFGPKMIICSYKVTWSTTGRRENVPRYPNQVVLPLTERTHQAISAESQMTTGTWRDYLRMF
jgi:hypothetical protein